MSGFILFLRNPLSSEKPLFSSDTSDLADDKVIGSSCGFRLCAVGSDRGRDHGYKLTVIRSSGCRRRRSGSCRALCCCLLCLFVLFRNLLFAGGSEQPAEQGDDQAQEDQDRKSRSHTQKGVKTRLLNKLSECVLDIRSD